jgi:hypothetical protein
MRITTRGTTLKEIKPSEFKNLRSVIGAIQKTPVMLKISNVSKNDDVTYNGHSIDFKNTSLVGQCISNSLNDMTLCYRDGKIYSGNSSVFTERFSQCLVRFLSCFSFWLRNPGSLTIEASEIKNGMKWLITVMKATECYSRRREICIGNVIKKL